MIDIRHVSKAYRVRHGWNQVLDDISIQFPSDRNIGILGLNGSGKSTLLRLIGNVEPPDKGEIYRDVKVSWPIGFSGGISPEMTGREGTRFVARIYGADIKETEKFVQDFSELGHYYDMRVKTYSSGMRSRLGFAVSMAMEFECYLVDEITAVGDARFRDKYRKEFHSRKERSNLIIVSHQAATIQDSCDMAAVLFDSKITLYDSVDEGMRVYKESIEQVKRK
jgi:capsular polysaccharide transport system ATP-binding protein